MKKKQNLIHHYAILIVLALVAALSIGLLISGAAQSVGSTYSNANGTYQLIGESENPGGGTYSYDTVTYGTANLVVFKQATSFVVWTDSTISDSDAIIIAAVQSLGSSYANMDFWAVTTSTSFNMYNVLLAANPSATLNENALDVDISINTSAHTFTLSKGISHYSLFKYTPYTAELVVDKDVTGTNASNSEKFSITVTFTGSNLGGITNNGSLTVANDGIYTLSLSGSDTPVTFSNIPYGTSYMVTEAISGAQATAGWSYTSGAVTAPVVLNSGDTSDMVTILNNFSPSASLVVDKDVLGTNASTAEDFSITVTFTGGNLGGITNNAGLTGTDGVYTFALSGGGTPVTFSNIPYETSYAVTETISGAQTAAGWAYTSGQLTAPVVLSDINTSDTVTIVNTYTEPTASLVVDKSVTGTNASTTEDFSIMVTFTGSNPTGITNNAGLTVANDGVYTFLLSGSDTPITFSNIPYGTSYTVTEAISGAQSTASWTYTTGAVIQAVLLGIGNPSDTVEIVNNYGPTASLVVDKTVTGINPSTTEAFSITVTFTGSNLGDIINNADLTGTNGVYALSLTGSDPAVTFSNIPYGTQYTVTETVSGTQGNAGWTYISGAVEAAATLNIENPADTVEILNAYNPTATLTVDKSVAGINAATSEMFSMTVTFTGSNLGNITNNANLAVANDGVYTFTLSGSNTPVTFSKIPFGTSYTVTEAVSGEQTADGWAYTSGQVSEPAALNIETPVTVEILNTYTPTATLSVDKFVTGTNASTAEKFSMTVTFTGENLDSIVNSAGPNVPSGVYTFLLSGSDTPVKFSKIPYGTSYTVTEAVSGGQAADGWTNTTGAVSQAVLLGSENPTDAVNIINNFGPTASLAIDKNVTGTGASISEKFSITVTFSGESVSVSDIANNASLTGINGVYTFTLSGSDAQVNFSNIPYGTQYTVNESISDTQANLGWAYSSGKVTEPVVLDIENTSDTVSIVNNYTPQTPPPPPPVIESGSLVVTKNVSGDDASTTEEFAVTVQFTGTFSGIANNAGFIGTGGVYTLSLIDGESVTFTNIPIGTTFTITENVTAVQTTNGWTGPSAASGTINSTTLVDVTVENVFSGTGVAGDSDSDTDSDTGGVAGDTDILPQTGGSSPSTLIGIMGLILVAAGGTAYLIMRKRSQSSSI